MGGRGTRRITVVYRGVPPSTNSCLVDTGGAASSPHTCTMYILPQNFRIVVKQLAHNENGYRDVLKEIFMSESNLIVLDCEKKILEEVLKQCQQVRAIL